MKVVNGVMTYTNEDVINTFTDVDEIMKGCRALTQMSINDIFIMGQFHQWAEAIVNNEDVDMEELVEVPQHFELLIQETQGI